MKFYTLNVVHAHTRTHIVVCNKSCNIYHMSHDFKQESCDSHVTSQYPKNGRNRDTVGFNSFSMPPVCVCVHHFRLLY